MNLITFALFSTKIPGTFLSPMKKKKHHFKKIFSLFCDYTFSMLVTLTITEFVKIYAAMYLMTVSTKFTVSFPTAMSFITYPLLTFTYFTICLMINDGLTIGTYLTKQRFAVKNEFKQSLLLTLNALTFNLCYFRIEDSLTSHDYRYQEMMEERVEKIDLHSLIKEENVLEEKEEEFHLAA